MDDIDYKLIQRIMSQGRITWSELGTFLEMSAPAAADRVRRLEEKGVIKGYSALVDPEAAGCGLTTFITVTLDRPENRDAFLQKIQRLAAIQECHHITGEEDYLLKVRCSGIRHLESIVSNELKGVPGVIKTRTNIVMSTLKETPALPVYRNERA